MNPEHERHIQEGLITSRAGTIFVPREEQDVSESELTLRENLFYGLKASDIPSSLETHIDCLASLPTTGIILDIGCGNGITTYALVRNYKGEKRDCIGIDINPKAIESALQFGKDTFNDEELAHFMVANVRDLNFVKEYFDGVIETGLFGGIGLEEREEITQRVFNLLKPKAIFGLTEFELNDSNLKQKKKYAEDLRYLLEHKMPGEYGDRIVWKNKKKKEIFFIGTHFEEETLINLLLKAGFIDINIRRQAIKFQSVRDNSIEKERIQLTVWGTKP